MLEPTFTFTIPSLHDGIPLSCRIYHPHQRSPSLSNVQKPWRSRGAIVAHPYTSLGGCYDDFVVLSVVAELMKIGIIVGTFNFRGAGSSKGTASWTSKPELVDYISFTGLFVHYINDIKSPSSVEPSPIQSRAPPCLTPIPSTSAITSIPITPNLPAALLIVGGYSYGSFIASHLPSIDAILDKFTNIAKGSLEAQIRLRSHSLSTQWNKAAQESRKGQDLRANIKLGDSTHISYGGEETEPGSRRTSRESRRSLDVIRRSVDRTRKFILRTQCAEIDFSNESHFDFKKIAKPQICYLLISPVLPPISLFLTMFSKLSSPSPFKDGACSQSKHKASSATGEQLVNHPTLAIYGDSDFLTSRKNLRKWAEGMSERPDSMFRFREIGGVGHFWQEQGADAKMRASLREWLQSCRII